MDNPVPQMHIAKTKPIQIRLNVMDEDAAVVSSLCRDSGLSITAIASAILHAGVRAIAANNNRLPLPLRFEIVEASEPSATAARERGLKLKR